VFQFWFNGRREMVKDIRSIEQIAGLTLVGAVVVGCWVVLRPFLSDILWAIVMCSATWPLHELLMRWLHSRRTLVAALMTLVISLAILTPFLVIGLTFTQSIDLASKWIESQFSAGLPPPPAWVDRIPRYGADIREYWLRVREDIWPAISGVQPWLAKGGLWLLDRSFDVAKGILHLSMSLLVAFFLYRDGAGAVRYVRQGLQQISGDTAQRMIDVVRVTVQAVVYGVFGTALAQALLAGLGFSIARVPSPLTLALLTFFLGLLPFGSPFVWGGAAIWLFSNSRTGSGIFMVIYGLLIINGADHVIRPLLMSRSARLSFITTFMGVLGGVSAFGFIGVFLGPTLLAIGYALISETLASHAAQFEPVVAPPK
jgi:predicted PurR-regulated permease PerM